MLALALSALAVAPIAAAAQSRDYLLGAPHGSLALRGGFAFARASSDVFDESMELFTLDRGDFSSFSGAADVAITVRPRFDVVFTGGYAQSSKDSEDREFVEIIGEDSLPIRQDTRLTRVPLTVSLKAYLMPRGRQIGTLAWVPERFAPFIGAGGGATWYRFQQTGDFVFQETEEIFTDALSSDGWAPTWHAFGGVDVALGPRFALVGEVRYAWASAELEQDYDGYEPIDLSGLQTTVGFQVRF
jgi:opacity protein-like surface antigen